MTLLHHVSRQWRRNIPMRNVIRYIFPAACLLLGIAAVFALDNYFGFWEDELYQAICVRRYSEAPLGLFSYYVGHLWTDIFGFSILNLRYLVSIETVLAVGVTTIFLYGLTANRLLCGAMFLLGCIVMKLAAYPLYNWDSGLYLFYSLAICILISLISRPSTGRYLLLGILIGCISLGRLPTSVFMPLALIIIWIANRHNDSGFSSLRGCFLVFISWLGCLIVLTTLIMGSPEAFIGSLRAENMISGHSPFKDSGRLFERVLYIADKLTTTWFPGIGCLALALVIPKVRHYVYKVIIILPWILFCFTLAWAWMEIWYCEFPLLLGGDVVLGLGLLLCWPVYLLFHRRVNNSLLCIKLGAVFCLYVSMCVGSDGFIERMTPGFTLPLLVGLLWELRIPEIRRFLKNFIVIALLTYGAMLGCQFYRLKRYYFRDAPTLTMEPFQGIKTGFFWEGIIRDVDNAVSLLREEETPYTVFGFHYPLELVFGPDSGLSFHTFHNDRIWRKEDWDINKDALMERVEAFVYSDRMEWEDREAILNDLRESGYTDSLRIGNAIILYRNSSREAP